jgi:hypothetical protein
MENFCTGLKIFWETAEHVYIVYTKYIKGADLLIEGHHQCHGVQE